MRCPDCNSAWSTVHTTRKIMNKVRRYRECKHCGKNFVTTEKADPPKDEKNEKGFYVILDDDDDIV